MDYSSPDPSSVLKKSPHDLPANRLETLRHAVQRLETEHLPTTENVDSRALQPALKVIANVERDPVLYNALLSHPLIKEGKPQAARKGGKAGSVGSRRKVRPRVNFQEQVCRVLVIGLHNRSLQTVLVGLKALMCLYESSLESKEETLLPESTEVFSVLSSIRLPSWDDYLQMLKQEEEVERSRRVQGWYLVHPGLMNTGLSISTFTLFIYSFPGSNLFVCFCRVSCNGIWDMIQGNLASRSARARLVK